MTLDDPELPKRYSCINKSFTESTKNIWKSVDQYYQQQNQAHVSNFWKYKVYVDIRRVFRGGVKYNKCYACVQTLSKNSKYTI